MRSLSLSISVHRLIFLSFVILFRVLLDTSYSTIIAKDFASEGFILNVEPFNYMVSWFLYLISLLIVSDRVKNVSQYFFVTAILCLVAPLTSLYGLDATRPLFPVLVSLGAIFTSYFVSKQSLLSFKGLPVVLGGRPIALMVSLAFVVGLVIWFKLSGAKSNLNFSEVYEYRELNAELTAQGILAYTNNWTFQVFSVYLICFALYARRFLLVILLLGVQVYFFSVASHKSILFLPLLVFSVWIYLRRSDSLIILPLACVGVLVLTIASYIFLDDLWLTSLLSRRAFYVPADLCFVYFDFFSTHAHVYWSNSVLSSLQAYPYGSVAIPYVIGDYLGKPGMGANNGFISSGFAHAGLFGVFFYAALVGLLLKLVNDLSNERMPVWVAIAISIVPLRSLLMSSDLFTVMLTHGFAVAIVIMYLSRKKPSPVQAAML
ncbi:hypothetical protein [Pseudomonas juntendi]|uniref:hypothetical protein n=1 Tax=Pseudomonas juntendi TaxID=2666183 RepID=UPI003209256F